MKRINNLYNEILDLTRIQRIYRSRVRLNTKNKEKIERFENNYVSNMIYIKKVLEEKTYYPGRYNVFLIHEPKVRLIMSQNIIDKLINHVVTEYFLVNIFDKSLIDENVATRKNRGTHYGIKLLKRYINELKDDEFYILKFDISKYFFNIDHEITKNIIKTKIKDKDVLKILFQIIDSTDEKYVNEQINNLKNKQINKIRLYKNDNATRKINEIKNLPLYEKGKGVPIGNMSSQFIAILYLNELDHFVKEKLKVKHYIRYMDDGIILHKDKEYLKFCLAEITKIIHKYKLKLNDKTQITSIKEGFDFLGFRYYIKNNKIIMKVKKQTKRRFKRKMKKLYKLLDSERITLEELNQVKASYLGHLSYGDTKSLVRSTLQYRESTNKDMGNSVIIEDKNVIIENK